MSAVALAVTVMIRIIMIDYCIMYRHAIIISAMLSNHHYHPRHVLIAAAEETIDMNIINIMMMVITGGSQSQ